MPLCGIRRFSARSAMSPVPPAQSMSSWPGRGFSHADHRGLPQPMDAAAHQVVHQIVAAGDALEHAAHQRRLLGLGHVAVVARSAGRLRVPRSSGRKIPPSGRARHAAAIRRRTAIGCNARTARSRDRAARPGAEDHGRRISASSCAGPICASRSRRHWPSGSTGARDRRARPARQVHADRARRRRPVAAASRHVGADHRRRRDAAGRAPRSCGVDASTTARWCASTTRAASAPRLSAARRGRPAPAVRRARARSRSKPGFDGAYLAAALAGKMTSIKAALLDQRIVAGLGNIYVCEALFRARLSPQRLAGSIGRSASSAGWPRRSARCSTRRSRPAARRCATMSRPTASSAISSTAARSTAARASPAPAATAPRGCGASCNPAGRRFIAPSGSANPQTRGRGEGGGAAGRAFRVFGDPDRVKAGAHRVVDQQRAVEALAQPQQLLQHLDRLQGAEHAGDRRRGCRRSSQRGTRSGGGGSRNRQR